MVLLNRSFHVIMVMVSEGHGKLLKLLIPVGPNKIPRHYFQVLTEKGLI